ncbi:hypothetical protein KY290_011159 [Solanum tuberosum]|uniref:Uncharacterized protein n=1 Tax=Solanum tuberosum TaxID=4113 RepID=A0ABQ7VZT7_SOLTU|nr:hypothetical protein KY290_011159 [Solanum tuberosum]
MESVLISKGLASCSNAMMGPCLRALSSANGPETLRKDSPPRGNVVVLMLGIGTPNLVPVINGERGSIQLMGRNIVGHDGFPKFSSFRACEEDMFHVLAIVATHLAAQLPYPIKLFASFLDSVVWGGGLDVGVCRVGGELSIFGKVPGWLIFQVSVVANMDGLYASSEFLRQKFFFSLIERSYIMLHYVPDGPMVMDPFVIVETGLGSCVDNLSKAFFGRIPTLRWVSSSNL